VIAEGGKDNAEEQMAGMGPMGDNEERGHRQPPSPHGGGGRNLKG